ncbi:helix-turn-helix domain-containing protein [Lactobacillus gallinarum]|uniref:helix-turn-helix domain-containing protein n=1 Tax=Lactobacillus gallinarum TaxID=52242 RepID=UPI000B390610|nr:helix-turn-helix domain-containing protein [Lactobacillus gallinarum]OUQ01942.1 DNA-binding protein [Lactobacillus gallinarum]OUQ50908.1 DNA-binding protein [Lactobacillus gallinarum]
MSKEYLTFKEAMSYMGFTTYDSLRKVIKLGLPIIKFGNSKRISKNAIDEFMQAHTTAVHPKKEVANHD